MRSADSNAGFCVSDFTISNKLCKTLWRSLYILCLKSGEVGESGTFVESCPILSLKYPKDIPTSIGEIMNTYKGFGYFSPYPQ